MNQQTRIFEEWIRTRAAMIEPPWYKVWVNWALILLFALFMFLASLFLLSLNQTPRGVLLDVPFPRTQRALA